MKLSGLLSGLTLATAASATTGKSFNNTFNTDPPSTDTSIYPSLLRHWLR